MPTAFLQERATGPGPCHVPASNAGAAVPPQRAAIEAATRRPEPELLPGLIEEARLAPADAAAAERLALRLARPLREAARRLRPAPAWCRACCRSSRSLAGRRRADVPGRGAAAHSRRGDARRADPRQDRRAASGTRTSAAAPRCSSTPRPGACSSPASWSRRTASRPRRARSRASSRKGGEPLIRKGVDLAMRADGRAVRHRRDDRRGARQCAAARGARAFAIRTTCSAKRR